MIILLVIATLILGVAIGIGATLYVIRKHGRYFLLDEESLEDIWNSGALWGDTVHHYSKEKFDELVRDLREND